jgi:hypothetical protein
MNDFNISVEHLKIERIKIYKKGCNAQIVQRFGIKTSFIYFVFVETIIYWRGKLENSIDCRLDWKLLI